MLGALFGRAELRVGEPDALDAVALVQRLDLLGDFDRIAVALMRALDLVVEAEMALERAAALGVHADVVAQIVAKVGKDRFDVGEIDRRKLAQIEGFGARAMLDATGMVLVEKLADRLGEAIDDGQHGVLAFADDDHRVGRTFLGDVFAEDRHRRAADHDARRGQQSSGPASCSRSCAAGWRRSRR